MRRQSNRPPAGADDRWVAPEGTAVGAHQAARIDLLAFQARWAEAGGTFDFRPLFALFAQYWQKYFDDVGDGWTVGGHVFVDWASEVLARWTPTLTPSIWERRLYPAGPLP